MSPPKKCGWVHRYYVTREVIAEGYDSCPVRSVPAADVGATVLAQEQRLLTTPEMIARNWTATKGELDEREVLGIFADLGSLWAELFPAEQARIMKLLVERVNIRSIGWRCGSGRRGWPASWPSCGSSRCRRRRPKKCMPKAGSKVAPWLCASRCGSAGIAAESASWRPTEAS